MSDWNEGGWRNAKPLSAPSPPPQLTGHIYTTFPLAADIGIPPPDHADRLRELLFPVDPEKYALRLPNDEEGRARWTWWQPMLYNSYSRIRQAMHPASRDWQESRDQYIRDGDGEYAQELERNRIAAARDAQAREQRRGAGRGNGSEQHHQQRALGGQTASRSTRPLQQPVPLPRTPPPGPRIGAGGLPHYAITDGGKTRGGSRPSISGALKINSAQTRARASTSSSKENDSNGSTPANTPLLSNTQTKPPTRCTACHQRRKGCDGKRPCGQCVSVGRTYEQCIPKYGEADKKKLKEAGLPNDLSPPPKSQGTGSTIRSASPFPNLSAAINSAGGGHHGRAAEPRGTEAFLTGLSGRTIEQQGRPASTSYRRESQRVENGNIDQARNRPRRGGRGLSEGHSEQEDDE